MTVMELLSRLRNLDVKLWAEDGRLRVSAAKDVLTPELRAELGARKEEILDVLRNSSRMKSEGVPPIARIARDGDLPLSFAQQRLWFLDQLVPNNSSYNMPRALRLQGELDKEALQETLDALMIRHEALRTTFRTERNMPVQVINEPVPFEIPVIDLRSMPEEQRESEIQRLMVEEAHCSFDLSRDPMLRVRLLCLGEQEHVLLMTMHHIASDGWSMGVIYKELAALYDAFIKGRPSPLPELPIQYVDFASWQRGWLQGEELEKQMVYWRRMLSDPPALQLSTDRPRPPIQTFRGAYDQLTLPRDISDALVQLSHREGATLFMTLLAAFDVLLHHYTGQEDLVVGSPIANRNRAEIEDLIGFFVNMLVMRTDLSGDPTFRSLLSQVREVALGSFASQDLPFEKLVDELDTDRDLSQNPLFQVTFALQNASKSGLELSGLKLQMMAPVVQTTRFDLEVHMQEGPDGVSMLFVYNTDLFDRGTIQRLMECYRRLLNAVVENPDRRVSEMSLLSEDERHQIVVDWNRTATEYPREATVHELFEKQVEKTPEAVAIEFGDVSLTYNQLNERANQLAHHLISLNVGPETPVAIFMDRSATMLAGLLGILKAGGAYVPLDSAYPANRLAFMLKDCAAPVLLTQENMLDRLPSKFEGKAPEIVVLDQELQVVAGQSRDNPELATRNSPLATNLAYIIYTSGSTGIPKGVCVPHRAINRLVRNTDYVDLQPTDRIAQVANCSFDAATFEIWGALLTGARIVGITKDVALAPDAFAAELKKQSITTLFLTTALFNNLAREVPGVFGSLRYVLFGGEEVDPQWVRSVLENSPPERLLHVYGPTETTTYSHWHRVREVKENAMTVPIGRPIANTTHYVLDARMKPVPVGVPGELLIGGDGVARGYLNRPELTAEKFVPDTFSDQPDQCLYRTGDWARYLEDGSIEFLGRRDNQVKVRGFRIELGEIEAELDRHPALRETVVLAREDEPGETRLVAYLVPERDLPEDTENAEDQSQRSQWKDEHVDQWQKLYEQLYDSTPDDQDPTFNITGWNSSYTDDPIPADEMAEWVEATVGRIKALGPKRVYEIGFGTGLLLFRIAPDCERFLGADFSEVASRQVQAQLDRREDLSHVKVMQRMAENFEGIEPRSFDTVIINSVTQYFPDMPYLVRVLEGALDAVAPGGRIFLGDVRSHALLETFQASIQLARAKGSLTSDQLKRHIQQYMDQETELTIDPVFFRALSLHLPRISHVEILVKRGHAHNELTRFRYDVVLHVEAGEASLADESWLDWDKDGLSVPELRKKLERDQPDRLAVTHVPNKRLAAEVRTLNWLNGSDEQGTLDELRKSIKAMDERGVDPEELGAIASDLPYRMDLSYSDWGADGRMDVVFRRAEPGNEERPLVVSRCTGDQVRIRPWSAYANDPLKDKLIQELIPRLRDDLKEKLPEYMIPTAFVVLNELPLNPNGKVDRRALPAPGQSRAELAGAYVAPNTPTEKSLVKIWEEVLRLDQVGINDDFFDLGGHSLMATQVISRVRETFKTELPVASLFECPTVASMADEIETLIWAAKGDGKSDVGPIAQNREMGTI